MKTGKRIPIDAVKQIGQNYGYNQVIVISWDKETGITSVATWGKTLEDCDQAASGGNLIKSKILNWKKELCQCEPSRVIKLKNEISALKKQRRSLVRLIDGCKGEAEESIHCTNRKLDAWNQAVLTLCELLKEELMKESK